MDRQPRSHVELLGIDIWRASFDEALAECRERANARSGGYACFVNVHTLTGSTTDARLRVALTEATYCFADGVPLLWLSRLRAQSIVGRASGPDFMDAMLTLERNRRHGFIGGRPGTGSDIARRYGIEAVFYSPPMRPYSDSNAQEDWQQFQRSCGGKLPDIVWVGLGAPKQELWMRTIHQVAPEILFFGVGAAFDFLSNRVPRAPRWMQRIGLEWAYRLSADPKRLLRRYLTTNVRFAALCAREIINSRAGE